MQRAAQRLRQRVGNITLRKLWGSSETVTSGAGGSANVSGTPRVPLILGYAGTLPFLCGALVTTFARDADKPAALTQVYGGSILSFLGGIHWGLALTQASTVKTLWIITAPACDFAVSVIPSLVGVGAMLMPPVQGLPILAGSFAGLWVYDRIRLSTLANVPRWYISLRAPMSIAAAGACFVSWCAVRRLSDVEELKVVKTKEVVQQVPIVVTESIDSAANENAHSGEEISSMTETLPLPETEAPELGTADPEERQEQPSE